MAFQNGYEKNDCSSVNSAKAVLEVFTDNDKARERLDKIQRADLEVKMSQHKILIEQNDLLKNQLKEQKTAYSELKLELSKSGKINIAMLVIALISALIAASSLIAMFIAR